MRILIVKVSALGDVVHALPVLEYLHQTIAGVEIDWVVEEAFQEMLSDNPLISTIHTVRFKQWKKRPLSAAVRREVAAVRSALRDRQYDVVFDLQGNIKSGAIAWLTGATRRYGFDRDGVRELPNVWLTTTQVPLRRQDYHVTDRSLRLVSVLGRRDYAQMSLRTDIATSPADDYEAEVFLATMADGLVFLIHHGTTWPTKLWHEDGWSDLGKRLLERHPDATVLLSWGGEKEFEAAGRIAAAIGERARLVPRTTLKGLAAFLKKVDLVIGGDTGPIHMAAAVGTPTVSLYRATDGRRNGPRGGQHRIVQSPLACCRCLNRTCDKDDACRRSITVEMMLNGCETLLGGGA